MFATEMNQIGTKVRILKSRKIKVGTIAFIVCAPRQFAYGLAEWSIKVQGENKKGETILSWVKADNVELVK